MASVVKTVNEDIGEDTKPSFVKEVMRTRGMKFRKVKHIPMLANSERSLILRQRWALAFFGLPQGKRLIFLDETWLG